MPRVEQEKIIKLSEFLSDTFLYPGPVGISQRTDILLCLPMLGNFLLCSIARACFLHLLPICWSFDEKLFFIRTDPSCFPFTHLLISSSSTKRNLVIGSAFLLTIVYMWNLSVTFESYILNSTWVHSIHLLLPPQHLSIVFLPLVSSLISCPHSLSSCPFQAWKT